MPWARLDDDYFTHRKTARLSKDAKLLDLAGITFSARELRDGILSDLDVRVVAAQVDIRDIDACLDELNHAARWFRLEGAWEIHDYLVYNPSRVEVLRERTMRETRKSLYNDPFLTQRVRKRDGDRCRYCSIVVRWNDRKGPGGGTYDHVDPEGGNSDENIVVACRGCNGRKGKRTPAAASMVLLAPTGDLPEIHPKSNGKSSYPYPVPDPVNSPVPDPVPAGARTRARETDPSRSCSACQQHLPRRSPKHGLCADCHGKALVAAKAANVDATHISLEQLADLARA